MAMALPRCVARSIPKNAFSTLAEDVKTSTLSNGIKVMSKELGSESAVVGVSVNAGARHGTKGEAFLLQHMGFKGTTARSDIKLAREIEGAGVSVKCDADRDSIVYSASGLKSTTLSAGMEVVAEASLTPKLLSWHINEMQYEAVGVALKFAEKDPVKQLVDKLHEASYGKHAAMGRLFYQQPTVDAPGVQAYHNALYTTGNMTVVGAGVSHEELVSATEASFGGSKTTQGSATTSPQSEFVGGFAYNDKVCACCHVAVGFKSPSSGGAEHVNCLVLQELWKQGVVAAGGGGDSFSVNYADGGVVGVYGSTGASAGALTETLVSVLKAPISDNAVASAKMAVKTRLAVEQESALGSFDALLSPNNGSYSQVDKVSTDSVKALATQLTKSTPALASVGPDSGIPAYNTFAKMF